MYTFLYGLRSIARHRERYLLFALALIALCAVIFVNLTLGLLSDKFCDVLKIEYGSWVNLVATNLQTDSAKIETYMAFDHPELVEEIEPRTATAHFTANGNTELPCPYIWLVGINDDFPTLFTRVRNPAVLLEGRLAEKGDECVISDRFFARLQEAGMITAVGEQITLENVAYGYDSQTDSYFVAMSEKLPLTVVGLVDHDTLEQRYQCDNPNPKEVVFMAFDTVSQRLESMKLINVYYDSAIYNPKTNLKDGYEVIYHLRSYQDAEAFNRYVEEKSFASLVEQTKEQDITKKQELSQIAHKVFVAEPLMPEFEQILTPLEQLQTFTGITTVTVAVLAVAVVALMSVINMRERKYELGVLRCVGMSKARISLTLGIESLAFLLITAALGIALGFGFASLFGDAFVDLTIVDTTIDTMAISGAVALRLVIAALALSIFATVISAAFVMRARPLAILRNRT